MKKYIITSLLSKGKMKMMWRSITALDCTIWLKQLAYSNVAFFIGVSCIVIRHDDFIAFEISRHANISLYIQKHYRLIILYDILFLCLLNIYMVCMYFYLS